jgi:hypothetical protein
MNDAVITKRVCTKTIGECLTEPEMLMDSESNRRVLAMQKKYISYDTLKRDMVPCDRPGASYYNCHRRQANPYSRGCEVITACARGAQSQEINTWHFTLKWIKEGFLFLSFPFPYLTLSCCCFVYELFSM